MPMPHRQLLKLGWIEPLLVIRVHQAAVAHQDCDKGAVCASRRCNMIE
jgi:hypothetical protein